MNRRSGTMVSWILLAASVFPLCAEADTRYVSPSGGHVAPFASWEEASTNIQSAIDASAPGDVVVVANGRYVLEDTVRVTNQVSLTSLNGRDSATLDGSALSPGQDAVLLQFGVLDGFTVSNAPRHGVKCEHGSIFNSRITRSGQNGIDSYTTPRIVANSTLIVSNTIVLLSGANGIYTCAVDTRIDDCAISSSEGTGVSLRQNDTTGVIQVPRVSNFLIRASTVSSNMNSGIMLTFYNFTADLPKVPVRIEDCLIEDNVGVRGGGICDGVVRDDITDRSAGCQIIRSVIRRNTATAHGGGVYLFHNRAPSIRSSVVEDNFSEGVGGGLSMSSGAMDNCLVRGNACATDGGGVSMSATVLRNSTIVHNMAHRGGGTAGGEVRNCIV